MLFHEVCREVGIWDGDWRKMSSNEWIIEARNQIKAFGYIEKPCDKCNGSGLSIDTYGAGVMTCNKCMVAGTIWVAPAMKSKHKI